MAMANETVTQRKRTVLIVEDNETNREILTELLEDEYDVLQAENGQDGLEQLVAHAGDVSLVMLDAYMPVRSGFEFLEQKRKDPRFDAIPVIVMTASNAVDDEIRCLELGASDFITKPYNVEVMKNRMKSLIRLRESSTMLGRLETDSLTGLYSKEFFYHSVEELLAANPDERYDMVCSDIENFRALNDRYGTAQCDSFLRDVADDLGERIPGLLFGGRIGADVFAFLLRHCIDDGLPVVPISVNVSRRDFETAEQVEALKVLGCDYIQGYYFSKPLPVNEYEEYLKAHT